jgi:large subunit ribosomal protein L6
MKIKLAESLEIPEGIDCEFADKVITCKKGSVSLSRNINVPGIKVKIEGRTIHFIGEKTNKNEYKKVKSNIAHIKNLFQGLNEKFVYQLESANVHFPMTLKVANGRLEINNFLGEKTPRYAKILPNVTVDVKGAKITVSSNSKEAAGQVVSYIEAATKVRNRDRRVFQDGIYLTDKPRRKD